MEKPSKRQLDKRTSLRQKKLDRFFGQSIPVDISAEDLQKYGLKAMLKSRVPLCYFLYLLLEELCSENLFFYLEAEQFEKTTFKSKDELKFVGFQLYDLFIDSGSIFQINIDAKVKRSVLEALQDADPKSFQPAKDHIEKLMEPVYKKFEKSPIYRKMVEDIGNTSVYDGEIRKDAVQLIKINLEKTTSQKGSEFLDARNRLLKQMCHAFCSRNLGVDFEDEPDIIEPEQASQSTDIRTESKQDSMRSDPFMTYLDSM